MGIQSKDCTLQFYSVCVDYTSIEKKKAVFVEFIFKE